MSKTSNDNRRAGGQPGRGGAPGGGRNGGQGGARHGGRPGGSHPGNRATTNAQPITAPYNFVPLSGEVFFPEWRDRVSHDVPFSDGIDGVIEFELQAHTDLLVAEPKRGQEPRGFFRLPGDDGRAAVPGSSLRGMLRAVLEVAAFGKMQLIDDRALSVRDLNNQDLYGKRMTQSRRGSSGTIFESRSRAGWLQFADGRWVLTPVPHWRVRYAVLDQYTGLNWAQKLHRATSAEKYALFQQQGRRRNVWFEGDAEPCEHAHGDKMSLVYREATRIFTDEPTDEERSQALRTKRKLTRGALVFTGQVGKKKSDFIFQLPLKSARTIEVDERTLRAFMQIHSEAEDSDWNTWFKPRALKGERIPVFYLADDQGAPTAIGLAQMFRLAYKHGLHDAVRHSGDVHFSSEADLVELLFGRLADEGRAGGAEAPGLRSRVSVGLAVEHGGVRENQPVHVVLNGPKPSYYPNYIAQDGAERSGLVRFESHGRDNKAKSLYRTLMDDGVQLRGRKRYPVRGASVLQSVSPSNITSHVRPLAAGARFRGRVRVHNLRPVELGALLWAMTWGGRTHLQHGLGMAKSMGCGAVSLRLVAHRLSNPQGESPDPAALMAAFEARMEAFCRDKEVEGAGEWLRSEQMFELLAMADPANAARPGVDLRHMVLNPDAKRNDFVKAKGSLQGNVRGAVLRSYSSMAGLQRK